MVFRSIHDTETGTLCRYSLAQPGESTAECHAMIELEPRGDTFSSQAERLRQAQAKLMATEELRGAQCVFKRYYLSDPTNQQALIADHAQCTISYIGQPPLNGTKIALWIYLVGIGAQVEYHADRLGSTVVRHNGYTHLWTMGMTSEGADSYTQTHRLIQDYNGLLSLPYQGSMERNCLRTWFFVRDVDTNYRGLVIARKALFEQMGMTTTTHYIASTGIGGSPADVKALVQFGAHSLFSDTEDIAARTQYLYAPTHLNRTSEYGVTFERGTAIDLGDRRLAYISGTASINNRGEVMHEGDIEAQTRRMWENIETLLAECSMNLNDIMQATIYLRDIADYTIVRQMFEQRFPHTPHLITLAPVCRPAWLIEMECVAMKSL